MVQKSAGWHGKWQGGCTRRRQSWPWVKEEFLSSPDTGQSGLRNWGSASQRWAWSLGYLGFHLAPFINISVSSLSPDLSEPQFPPVGNSFTPCSPFRDLGKGWLSAALAVGEGRYSRKGKGALGILWSGWSQSSPSTCPAAPAGAPPIGAPPAAGRVLELPGRGSALARGQITPST